MKLLPVEAAKLITTRAPTAAVVRIHALRPAPASVVTNLAPTLKTARTVGCVDFLWQKAA